MPKVLTGRAIRLNYRDGQVVVTPEDDDIFVISAEKATEACREAVRREDRIACFKRNLLLPLHQWCLEHADKVSACYIPLPAGHVQVFVVTTSPRFDFDLASDVADIERRLANEGWRVGVIQLPHTDELSLATFFNREGALEVHARPGSAPKEGGE